MFRNRMAFASLILAAGCSTNSGESSSTQPIAENCQPLETRAASVPDQRPAFAGQTRACGIKTNVAYDVTVLARNLVHPWAVEPLPNGDLLITERPGRLRIVTASGKLGDPITGLPAVDARGQGGLLDVALSPNFESNRTIFWSYSEPGEGGNTTAVARGTLSEDLRSVSNVQVIFRALPRYSGTMHFGSRLNFGPDTKLYITVGERSDAPMRQYAQRMDSHLGKTLRINSDGTAPSDNPFVGQNAQPQIWSVGHRNPQAAAFDAQGRYWVIEHGTNGGDELNLVTKGQNYGWPIQAYGKEYSGQPIPGASPAPPQFVQPRYYWDPVIAPSGAQWYTGAMFPAWRNSLFVGALKEKRLVRLVLNGDRVAAEEHLLTERGQRIRDVRQGPDGALYVVTDEDAGELWRITKK